MFGFTFLFGRMTEVLTPDIYGAHWYNQVEHATNHESKPKTTDARTKSRFYTIRYTILKWLRMANNYAKISNGVTQAWHRSLAHIIYHIESSALYIAKF